MMRGQWEVLITPLDRMLLWNGTALMAHHLIGGIFWCSSSNQLMFRHSWMNSQRQKWKLQDMETLTITCMETRKKFDKNFDQRILLYDVQLTINLPLYHSFLKLYHSSMPPFYHSIILPFHSITSLFYHSTILPCCYSTILPCQYSSILSFYHSILSFYHSILPRYHSSTLPFFHSILLSTIKSLFSYSFILPFYHSRRLDSIILRLYHSTI